MKYFLDTEFYERPCTIELISIGIVAEDGREFYAENREFDLRVFDLEPWLNENIKPHLMFRTIKGLSPTVNREPGDPLTSVYDTKEGIGKWVKSWIGDDEPEFWAFYGDYDWVVFCWLFGRMIDLPEGWPMYCRDIKQLIDEKGNPRKPDQKGSEHNALADARYNKDLYEWAYAI